MFKKLPTYDKSKTFSQNIRDSIPSQNSQNSTVDNGCEEDEELIESSQPNFTLPKPKMFLKTKARISKDCEETDSSVRSPTKFQNTYSKVQPYNI